MLIIGCDFHTRYQQIAMMDEATGELIERRLDHESGEALKKVPAVRLSSPCSGFTCGGFGLGPSESYVRTARQGNPSARTPSSALQGLIHESNCGAITEARNRTCDYS